MCISCNPVKTEDLIGVFNYTIVCIYKRYLMFNQMHIVIVQSGLDYKSFFFSRVVVHVE